MSAAAAIVRQLSPRPIDKVYVDEREQRISKRVDAMTASDIDAYWSELTLADRKVIVGALMFDDAEVH